MELTARSRCPSGDRSQERQEGDQLISGAAGKAFQQRGVRVPEQPDGHRVPTADREPAEHERDEGDHEEQKADAGQLRVVTVRRVVLCRHGPIVSAFRPIGATG